jgi:hypothetical protein
MSLSFITIISLKVPNKSGSFTNVIVGLEEAQDYIQTNSYTMLLF